MSKKTEDATPPPVPSLTEEIERLRLRRNPLLDGLPVSETAKLRHELGATSARPVVAREADDH